MKRILLLVSAAMVVAACSAPKTAYYFDRYDYNSGRKNVVMHPEQQPIPLDATALSASAENVPADFPHQPVKAETKPVNAPEASPKKYSDMTKAEKKEFRREVKKDFKAYVKAVKKGDAVERAEATAAMDNDLKLAIIFGAVGLTLTLFGAINEAFWILGVISIVVGVVFLIKWLVRQ